jgi:hypothetical protein
MSEPEDTDIGTAEPTSTIYYPIVDNFELLDVQDASSYDRNSTTSGTIVKAILVVTIKWSAVLSNMFDDTVSTDVALVLKSSCSQSTDFTFTVTGSEAKFVGRGELNNYNADDDLHEIAGISDINLSSHSEFPFIVVGQCMYYFHVHPHPYTQMVIPNTGKMIAFSFLIFVLVALPYVAFHMYVQKLSHKFDEIQTSAKRSNDIVSSLFPEKVHAQLYNRRTSSCQSGSDPSRGDTDDIPIAELYPETTVMFAGK